MKKNVYITDTNCVTPLGFDVVSNWDALLKGQSGIGLHEKLGMLESFYAAVIDSEQLDTAFSGISKDNHFTRLEKMLILALAPIIGQHKITNRTAFVFSTTKGNIRLLENENNPIEKAHLSALAKKISTFFGFVTEPIVVSNACVSGVLAIAVAKRMIQTGVYDNAFVLAGDEVSEFVLSGFNSFQAMSAMPCTPYDKERSGVTLGEATAAVYLTSDSDEVRQGDVKVVGDGAINDANHISGPSRTGEGLFRSIKSAFAESGLQTNVTDYISAHGTATLYNDEMEAIAFNRLGLQKVPVNSLKGYYGHTLGASGLLETVIAIESARKNQLIGSKGFSAMGVSQPIEVVAEKKAKEIKYFLKTASGFGGCNTAVLFEKVS
ncbi:beta-ketoacyl synthase [Flavobacterium cauense R2A-7]|uniref:3-oxoacyl-[acyl-carrier-protein] synthase-1 n=1 Tax=Flavobacterium cauense R2A-7 TaxID=1341154 RepID=V6RZL5_9FLAO|nr:beta-ketoacyl synthase N-terminal-like domain-containing protein [Flavobacterium cauense]ESU19916.1 beta-ketoacyl synthase [Flavobacterium cauense R2A-7]KGO83722.1 beta-ketoacyl synthase [Flavobacterium cauense R2A-7]TWI12335.1 3-oxoacyl-[acyl-carrier-protein] synthase-1 [Flavobacterium cauense R2A-7]